MVETAWVLERAYGLTAREIAAVLERMLHIHALVVKHEQEVFTAIIAFRESRGQFANALIAAIGAEAGCKHTLTFDQRRCGCEGFCAREY